MTALDYEFRRMAPEDVETVKRFMAAHVPAGSPQVGPGWLEWQYPQHPISCDVRLCFVADQLVGMSGFLPTPLAGGTPGWTGAFSTNTFVDPAHRRRGIGEEIHRQRVRDYDVALSSGQSPANLALYRQLGFTVCGRYRKAFVSTRPFSGRRPARWARQLASWLRWTARRRRPGADLRVDSSGIPPQLPSSAFEERWPTDAIGSCWNNEYLVWRYGRHPYFQYRFLTVFRGQECLGTAVVRSGGNATVLADLFCRASEMVSLLDAVTLHTPGVIVAQHVGAPLTAVFRRAGWLVSAEKSLLLAASRDPAIVQKAAAGALCFFAGDSDKDR